MDTQILAIGALVILVWAGVVLARGSLVGTALAVLVAGSCFGYAFFHVDVGRVPVTADRLLLLVLLGQYAIYRHWGRINLVPLLKTDYVLAAFLVALAVSTLVHDYWAPNLQPLATLTFSFLTPAVIYWTVRHGQWTGRTAWGVFGTLAAFGVYLSLTTVAETLGAWNLVFPRYIAAGEFAVHLGGRGPFLNPVATGLIQTLGMCATLVLLPRVKRPGRFLLLLLLGVFAVGIYSTHAPGVWLGAGAALCVMLIAAAEGRWRIRAVAATVATAAIVAGVSWQQFPARGHGTPLPTPAAGARAAAPFESQATLAWRMFLKRPILGCGLGQYPREAPAYGVDRAGEFSGEPTWATGPNNAFVSLLVETGLLGVGLFVALLSCWTRTAWRLWRAASAPRWTRQTALLFLGFLTAYLVGAMFHDLSTAPMTNMFLFFLGGSISGLTPWLASPTMEIRVERWRVRQEPDLVAS